MGVSAVLSQVFVANVRRGVGAVYGMRGFDPGDTWLDDPQPIRIPGAEDYKAPKQFREEILEAMEDQSAPAGFSEQVKRYYKDIIQ